MIRSEFAITVDRAQPSEWDELIRGFPNHTVFHSWSWLQTIEKAHGVRPLLARADRAGQCIAVWPVLELRKGPLRVIGSPLPGWSTAYMGPLFAANAPVQETLNAFFSHSLFRRYAYFACKVLDHDVPINLEEFGFSEVMRFDTYLIDLTLDTETLWSNLKGECRTRIRKAQKLGIEVRLEQTGEFIDDFWRMSIETFSKASIQPTHTREFVQALWDQLGESKSVIALSAFVEGDRAAILVLPFDSNAMYYWGGAAYLKHRNIPAHNLLHWNAIEQGKRMGLRHYDMISTIGGPGRFKSTFGPQVVEIARHWERSPSRWMAALKEQYRRYLLKRRRTDLVEQAQGCDSLNPVNS